MDRPEGCHRLYPFRSLRMQEANSLRERHCVPFSVLETHCSPNRRDRVGIVGIVVVQLSTVARVANANVVGVPGVRSPKQRKLQAPRSHVVCSLNCFIEKFCIISPIGFQHPLREILRGCCQFRPKFTSVIGDFPFDVHRIDTGAERI